MNFLQPVVHLTLFLISVVLLSCTILFCFFLIIFIYSDYGDGCVASERNVGICFFFIPLRKKQIIRNIILKSAIFETIPWNGLHHSIHCSSCWRLDAKHDWNVVELRKSLIGSWLIWYAIALANCQMMRWECIKLNAGSHNDGYLHPMTCIRIIASDKYSHNNSKIIIIPLFGTFFLFVLIHFFVVPDESTFTPFSYTNNVHKFVQLLFSHEFKMIVTRKLMTMRLPTNNLSRKCICEE